MPGNAANFATFLIVCPTAFFLGILFTNWVYSHHTLWNTDPLSPQLLSSIESHYTLLATSPPIIARLLHSVIFLGILGFLGKLYRASESNYLFDGASLVLYMVGVIMYATNLTKGFNIVASGEYGEEVGRIDTLRVIAASEVITALVLAGVLVLQGGQWYAERKEREEREGWEKVEEEEKRRKGTVAGKKRN